MYEVLCTVSGTFGVILYCLLINGLRGMPGWALGNIVIGIFLGMTFRAAKGMKTPAARIVLNTAGIAAGTALGILIVKSATESILYGQMLSVRIGKNLAAFIADLVVLIVSLPVCMTLDGTARKLFPKLAK